MTGLKMDDVPVLYQVRPRNFPEGEGWRKVSRRNFDDYGDSPGYPDAEWERRKLYAEPQPAPAIDLEQFRPAVFCMRNYTGVLPRRYWDKGSKAFSDEADRLQALIEGQVNNLNEQFGNPEELPPAIDLEQYAVAIQYAINGMREAGGSTNNAVARKLESLLAMIDGQGKSPTQAAWTDEQCAEFLAVAMRHVQVKGTLSMDEIRQGQARANAMQPTKGEGE